MKIMPAPLWLLCLAAVRTSAQSTTSNQLTESFSTLSTIPTSDFTGSQYTYITAESQSTVDSSTISASNNSASTSSTRSSSSGQITRSTSSVSLTLIGGLTPTNTLNSANSTASSTRSAAAASNTVPCNNYPEFCNRQYSNITEVCAHNSAFVVQGNAGSNQQLPILDQLNDGVRMLQGETHWVNNTIMNCHTSCDILNAGTWQSSLEILAGWIRDHPYDVVTWLIVNSDFTTVENYVAAIQNSGLGPYLYEPTYVPQHRDQWPTLAEMILSGKRVVLFMDYNANQTAVPYVLDEFSHMWETPFSPTNQSFPCTQQRPPGLAHDRARDEFMFLANHNLNTAIDVSAILGGSSSSSDALLIPNTAQINQTNGEFDQFGMLGAMSQNCTADWDRPPNFLLVDYYNRGYPQQGSVFEVAARANGVTYNRPCCGLQQSAATAMRHSLIAVLVAFGIAVSLT